MPDSPGVPCNGSTMQPCLWLYCSTLSRVAKQPLLPPPPLVLLPSLLWAALGATRSCNCESRHRSYPAQAGTVVGQMVSHGYDCWVAFRPQPAVPVQSPLCVES